MKHKLKKWRSLDQQGVTAMTMAIMLGVIVTFAAFAIDIGHALVTQNELQNASDAAALAAATQMGALYLALPREEQQDMTRQLTGDETLAIAGAAQTTAQANRASDLASVALAASDIQFGMWDFWNQTPQFTPTNVRPNAIQVTARRDSTAGSPNGPISTFFAGVFGVTQMDVMATSVAALDTVGGKALPGSVNAPFGIDSQYFANAQCGNTIKFSPTADSCAGWHNFTQDAHNTPAIKHTINGLNNGTFESPKIDFGTTTFDFTGGEVNSLFSNLRSLFDSQKDPTQHPDKPYLTDPQDPSGTRPIKDSNGDDFVKDDGSLVERYEWTVQIPVYENPDSTPGACKNAQNHLVIVGMATATVTYVGNGTGGGGGIDPWEKNREIFAEIQCRTFTNATPSPNPDGTRNLWDPWSPYPRIVS